MNKQTITIITGVVLIIAAFFGGKAYGAHTASAQNTARGAAFMNGANGARPNDVVGQGMIGGRTGRGGFGGATGQVVSKDATSITVSIPNGGSKIILYSPTTTVSKSTTGAISDVAVGSIITATGATNSDGSVTATNIQIRPAGMMPQGGQGSVTPKPAQ